MHAKQEKPENAMLQGFWGGACQVALWHRACPYAEAT